MNIYFFRRYLYTFDRRRIFLFSAAALIAVCLLWPVRWTISLPGEVRYAKEDRLIAHENGYILRSPPEGSHFFKTAAGQDHGRCTADADFQKAAQLSLFTQGAGEASEGSQCRQR